jgi:hypothetical protein
MGDRKRIFRSPFPVVRHTVDTVLKWTAKQGETGGGGCLLVGTTKNSAFASWLQQQSPAAKKSE